MIPHDSQNVLVPHPGQLPFSPCALQLWVSPERVWKCPPCAPVQLGAAPGSWHLDSLGLSRSDRNTGNLPRGGPCICPAAFVYFGAWVTSVCCSPTFGTHSCPFSLGQASRCQHSFSCERCQFPGPGDMAFSTSWLDVKPGLGRGCCSSEAPYCSH